MSVLQSSVDSEVHSGGTYKLEKCFTLHSVKELFDSIDNHTIIDLSKTTILCLLFLYCVSSVAMVLHFLFVIC